jgi:hypothetical protein
MKKNGKIGLYLFVSAIALMPIPTIQFTFEDYSCNYTIKDIKITTDKLNIDYSMPPPTVEWNKTFGGSQWDSLYCVQGTDDGGCVAVGVYTYTDNLNHAWILKLDASGTEEWSTIETSELFGMDFLMTFVQQTDDGGYIVSGYIFKLVNFTGVQYDVGILWKLDAYGKTDWIHWYLQQEEPIITIPWVVYEVDDGFLTAGYVTYSNKAQNIMLMKTNKTGDIEWKRVYDFWNGTSAGRSLCFTDDGGLLISGSSGYDLCLIKTDSNGNPEWYNTYGGSRNELALSRGCYQTNDGGYIFNGITSSYGAGNMDVWVVKTNNKGTMEWNQTYGDSKAETCYNLETTADGGYVFAATKNYGGISGTKDDLWIVRLDRYGYAHWNLTIGGAEEDRAYYICKTTDGGYIVSGRTKSYGTGDCDGWLIKIAPDPGLPVIQVDIHDGLGINMILTNQGTIDAIVVPWQISIKGGLIQLINKTINGTIDVPVGKSETISTGLFLGFGELDITIQVWNNKEVYKGKQFVFFTHIND